MSMNSYCFWFSTKLSHLRVERRDVHSVCEISLLEQPLNPKLQSIKLPSMVARWVSEQADILEFASEAVNAIGSARDQVS
jgi:hypothetical protein